MGGLPVTPASTFKIAISLMGFDAAFLQDEHFPTLPYHRGDPEKNNGLDRACISSSLKISPHEQIIFLKRLVNRQLPVSPHAFDMTSRILQIAQRPDGWDVHGKTGTAFPQMEDGSSDEAHGYGWFVGWATKDEHSLVFACLVQDDRVQPVPAGLRVRDALMEQWPQLSNSLVK